MKFGMVQSEPAFGVMFPGQSPCAGHGLHMGTQRWRPCKLPGPSLAPISDPGPTRTLTLTLILSLTLTEPQS